LQVHGQNKAGGSGHQANEQCTKTRKAGWVNVLALPLQPREELTFTTRSVVHAINQYINEMSVQLHSLRCPKHPTNAAFLFNVCVYINCLATSLDSGPVNMCSITLYSLTPIGLQSGESTLKANVLLTRDLQSFTHTKTQNFNFSAQKNYFLIFSVSNQLQKPNTAKL
jgi:hypothetical protein